MGFKMAGPPPRTSHRTEPPFHGATRMLGARPGGTMLDLKPTASDAMTGGTQQLDVRPVEGVTLLDPGVKHSR